MSGAGDAAGSQGPAQLETSDFIGFSVDTRGSPSNRFAPANCSSPQGNPPYFRNSRQWTNKKFNNWNHSSINNSHNNSYYNYHSPNRSFNTGHNRSYNRQNQSHNTSWNQSNQSFNGSWHFKARQDHNNTFNKQLYLHPSFMEDPWAELEANLNKPPSNQDKPK